MKVKELIEKLKTFNGDLEVTTTDNNGTFHSVDDVIIENWAGIYSSATIVLTKYDRDKCLSKNLYSDDDEQFIDNVNMNLDFEPKINKEEALKCKKIFEKDYINIKENFQKWYETNYKKIEKETMCELFEDDKPLEGRSLEDLKYYIYKNKLTNKIDNEALINNDRASILSILYSQLNSVISNKIIKDSKNICNEIYNI